MFKVNDKDAMATSFDVVYVSSFMTLNMLLLSPWCRGYHYWTTSFNWAWTQALRRFKPYSRRDGDSRWWGSLIMISGGNKFKHLSSINHKTKTIHHHHHHHHHHHFANLVLLFLLLTLDIWEVFKRLFKKLRY